MKSGELRQKYLEFFRSKSHKVIPSASLVPANDPTVLFTTAGMHPLVPYLLGEKHPAGKRLVNCQKCIRTGDIDEVGDGTHLTFFEMLGNWSLGDYFKKEAIEWSWEFLTEVLRLDPARLAVSCFAGEEAMGAPRDEEAAAVWRALGVPQSRIAFLGPADNWWGPAGQTGPCGPDTEMFYWIDDGEAAPADFSATREDKRWVEIWNDVFMQYNKTDQGAFEPLEQKNVDTGMGLDRVLAVMNGQASVYDTELFKPMFDVLALDQDIMTNQEVKKARIVLDHVRAAVFMVGDGVEPSNKDRGYVLRRLLRRALVSGKLLGLQGPWLKSLIGKVVTTYSEVYPDLVQNSDRIFKIILSEQEKFSSTLDKALKELEKIIQRVTEKNRVGAIGGKEAFDLYQSYGLPWEVTRELVEQSGLAVSPEEFEGEFKKHQELSRTASAGRFKGGLADATGEVVRLHTATHLLNAALRRVLGEHVWQRGSNITTERARFDFSHPKKLSEEEKRQVEELVNGWIAKDYPVKKQIMPLDEARKLSAIGVFGEKYGDVVSVYSIEDPSSGELISREFCGGPHVVSTGSIGRFKIVKEEASSSGVRRIKAVVQPAPSPSK
jgi:alanyl-tRNA synthetase